MKKTLIMALLLIFVLIGANAGAQQGEKEKDNVKAVDIKIHKKQTLPDDERKALDKAKGKLSALGDKAVFKPLATGILGKPIPAGGERYAIVIGLANYTGTVNDLCVSAAETADQFPENNGDLTAYCQDYDSVHMRDALINEYGYKSENIAILRDGSATKANIIDAMNQIRTKLAGKDDEVVFFFSGHGASGKYYGIKDRETIDEAVYTYDNKFIWDDDLKQWADSLSVYRAVFAFDICLAGGMNDLAGANRVLAMSSGETQSSWTYSLGGGLIGGETTYSEGLFSHYFIVDGMTNGLADGSNLNLYKDGDAAVEEAFSYAYPIVKIKQTPVLNDKFLNDLLLGYQVN